LNLLNYFSGRQIADDHPDRMKSIVIIAIVTCMCLIPFVNKAFHIDDPLFLWCAEQIQQQPMDFYGFSANWYGITAPMAEINMNPPFVSYFISAVRSFFGVSEIALHLAFLIPAVGLSTGIYYLARIFGPFPHFAALFGILTPVFLVSGTNIMTDIPMLALFVWAFVFWIRGLETERITFLVLSAVLLSLSALTKYFGFSLILLLISYTLMVRRKDAVRLIILLIPVAALAGYQILTQALYGSNLLTNAASYTLVVGALTSSTVFTRFLTGLSFMGGCLIGIVFYLPWLWSRRHLIYGCLALVLATFILTTVESAGAFLLPGISNTHWYIMFQYALFVLVGLNILVFTVRDVVEHRDAKSLILFLWIFGTSYFATFINWTISGRTILPMLPAVAILLMRRLKEPAGKMTVSRFALPLVPAAVLTLWITWADTSLANCQRTAADVIQADYGDHPGKIWFQGHWGFQYYMQLQGAEPLDFERSVLKQGDIIIIPRNNTNTRRLSENQFSLLNKKQLQPLPWLGTMFSETGSGFYSTLWGPMPFSFGQIKPEDYLIFITENI